MINKTYNSKFIQNKSAIPIKLNYNGRCVFYNELDLCQQ